LILSERDVVQWGFRIGREIAAPVFVGLRGQLGAGKSVLARAIARGAGVDVAIPSPTFNLLFRYQGKEVDVVHLDLYRLRSPDELWELGWDELGHGSEIVLVEWPERAAGHLPADRWDVALSAPEPGSPLREVRVAKIGRPPPLPGFPVTSESGQ
jgi:tRNA threonylcarbamoyl adenosine modification protein YjeE